MESETLLKIRAWLDERKTGPDTYNSHKAAIISSSDPFGLFGIYRDENGAEYFYLNGKLDSIDYQGKTVRFDK